MAELEATGQLDDTLIFLSSDNGPEMETWPDAAYSPFRSAKGSTWEGGQRVPGIVAWPGMIDADRASDGLFSQMDLFNTILRLAGADDSIPSDRYIDGVDQTSFLLAPDGESNRKFLYYWLVNVFSALRVGEWKFMVASTSDDDRDCLNLGGFTGVTQRYTHGRLVQPLPRPEGEPELPDPEARVHRQPHRRRAPALHDVREVPAEAADRRDE